MSVNYKAVEKGQPGVPGGGDKKHYASVVLKEQVELREMMRQIADRNTVNMPDVIAVVESFLEMFGQYIVDGRSINLGQLGYFTPSIRSYPEESAKDVNRSTIKDFRVNFRPSLLLKERLAAVRFQKVTDGEEGELEEESQE